MIQAQDLMNFGYLFIALKSLYTRPFYALEKPYQIPSILTINDTYNVHAIKWLADIHNAYYMRYHIA